MPSHQETLAPPGAGLQTRGVFCPAGLSGSRGGTRCRTANKGVVLSCRAIRKPLGRTHQDCELGGCFVLPDYQEAAGAPGAGLRTRGLFCPAGLSGSRGGTRCRTANKGVVLSCRIIRKPRGHPVQDCEQGGCFVLLGYQEAAGTPGAGLRTRGLFCPAGLSGSRGGTRCRTANKGVVLPCRKITKLQGYSKKNS
jgi:hypothetical protein